jgi:hypothetical protein
VLSEGVARWLLVLHTAIGVSAVATGTHLVIWLRRYLRGAPGRRRAVRKFAWLFFAFQLAAFVAGNSMYPTYKVEVRAAYLENAPAIVDSQAIHARTLSKLELREHGDVDELSATAELVKRAAQAARWFDVKEHWVALGLFASAAVVLVLSLWKPEGEPSVIAPFVLGLATLACATTWIAAIIGVLTASWRAV